MQDIEYSLKYTLDSVLLKLEDVKDVSVPNEIISFRKKFGDLKTLKLYTKDGKIFPLFNVPLSNGIKHTVEYCEVAVGESLFVTKEYSRTLNPPDKYSSFIINEKSDQFDLLLNDDNINIRDFSFIIKDSSRVLPLYSITFEYDEELERKSKGVIVCERCRSKQSISFCPSERANFCEQCDEEVHCDEFHKRHDRYYFNQGGKRRFIYCCIHSDTLVEYFCMICMIPICTKCKINGNHSELPNSSHGLVGYLEVCDILKNEVKMSNDQLNPVLEHLVSTIEDFKNTCSDFQINIKDIRQKIEDEYKAIMNEIDLYENTQYQNINAHYIKSISKLENLERMKNYAISLEPSLLVKNFRSVVQQRNELDVTNDINFVPKKVELKGKLSLGDPVSLTPRTTQSPRMDKTTKMYVETRGKVYNKTDNY
ncbi:putative zinc finger protein [Vairimorpha necatrix]|uniref:Zinc finger protein n=1 Tax=Vairimorpha necatrix TaxID=6039 RepID=A0AAX4J954_9MICR